MLALWSGLGYYRRADNLHEAARQIASRFEGRVPPGVDDLMSLPGIGRYTAGAIASVAYDQRAPVLDGNVTRVLARLFAVQGDTTAPAVNKTLWALAEDLLPQKRCGDFNQALMELGATICSPTSPQCLRCPLRSICMANQRGLVDKIPPPRVRTRLKSVEVVVAAIQSDGKLLFVQRPPKGLWAGLWELPSEELAPGEPHTSALGRLKRRVGMRLQFDRPLPPIERTLTHRRFIFHTYCGATKIPRPGTAYRWQSPNELQTLGLSRACESFLAQIDR